MRVCLVVVIVVLAGCSTGRHVHISPLPPTMTPHDRVAVFAQYRPGGRGVEYTTNCGRRGCTTSSRAVLVLADGREIIQGDDLLPLLTPGSRAHNAATEVARARVRKGRWKTGMLGTVLGGIGLMVAGSKLEVSGLSYAGGTVLLLGTGFCFVSMAWNGLMITRSSEVVFDTYEASLVERLQLCVNGLSMVPCEGNVPGGPVPAVVPDPVLRSLRQR